MIADRNLEERSYLRFEFFEGDKEKAHSRYLLMYENIEVRESRKAMISKMQPISRNSTFMAYTGAESRFFSVTFKITLPHIVKMCDLLGPKKSLGFTKEDQKRSFFPNSFKKESDFISAKGSSKDWASIYGLEMQRGRGDTDYTLPTYKSTPFQESINYSETNRDAAPGLAPVNLNTKERLEKIQESRNIYLFGRTPPVNTIGMNESVRRAVDIIYYWINLVRASVLNNAKNPTYGPPIIRLNHGMLYQDIPTICMDYKLDYDQSHGFDTTTLMPRVLTFELSLQELRVGNFKNYDVNNFIERDNIVGWESLISSPHSIDPIRFDIGK